MASKAVVGSSRPNRSAHAAEREPAFDEIYRRFHRDVYRLCLSLVREPARAEDLTQETFLRAFKHRRRFDSRRPYWPWLATIARRVCIDEIRARITHTHVDEALAALDDDARVGDTTFDEVANLDEQTRLRARLQTALRALSPRDRRVVLMRGVEGLSYQEIALADGTSVDAVRNVSWRARTVLRSMLEDLGKANAWIRVLALVAVMKASLARIRARAERLARPGYAASLEPLLAAQIAVLAVGVAALAIGSQSGRLVFEASHPDPRSADVVAATPRDESPGARVVSIAIPISPALPPSAAGVNAWVKMSEKEPKNLAPDSARLTIQVTGPNGNVLAENETWMECGDAGATLLPDDGLIRAVC